MTAGPDIAAQIATLRCDVTAIRAQLDGLEAAIEMLLPPPVSAVAAALRETALEFQVSVAAMISQQRDRKIHHARRTAYWVACETSRLSLSQIGHHFGDRDHTTIMAGRDHVARRRAADIAYRQTTDALVQRVRKVDAHA